MLSILVTGADGFVGRALLEQAAARGFRVRGATRLPRSLDAGTENVVVGAIDGATDWSAALQGVDVVIHLAARVHVMRDTHEDPLAEFLRVNLSGTENLARQAVRAGVKRFVYVSSIKVSGEQTAGEQVFAAGAEADPQDPYAVSKWRAELALGKVSRETGLETVIVRPPLIYGPGVKGNLLRLLQAVDKGVPLPFANVSNVRSMLYLGNMVDILLLCAVHPAAVGKTYLLRDGEDVSVPDLVSLLGRGLHRNARLFLLPRWLLRLLSTAAGQRGAFDRMTGSMRIDDAPIRCELGWKPRFSLKQGLEATTAWYSQQRDASSAPLLPKRDRSVPSCRVSIVIVNYNAGGILAESIARALQQAEQVIVVDNASSDGSAAALKAAFPQVAMIGNDRNLGFAKACNQGARIARGEYILFLNPDCILEAGAVDRLVQVIRSEPGVGMVGGLLTNPDGSEQGGGRRAVPTPWRSFVRAFGLSVLGKRWPRLFPSFVLHAQPLPDHPIEVEAISGACMLARRDALEQVGLLDEGYFMHCEDLDWCMRFHREGWKLLFVPDARMVHYKGYCSRSRPIFVEWNKHKGMMRFYRKFFQHQYFGALMWIVAFGVWLRFTMIVCYHLLDRLLFRAKLQHE